MRHGRLCRRLSRRLTALATVALCFALPVVTQPGITVSAATDAAVAVRPPAPPVLAAASGTYTVVAPGLAMTAGTPTALALAADAALPRPGWTDLRTLRVITAGADGAHVYVTDIHSNSGGAGVVYRVLSGTPGAFQLVYAVEAKTAASYNADGALVMTTSMQNTMTGFIVPPVVSIDYGTSGCGPCKTAAGLLGTIGATACLLGPEAAIACVAGTAGGAFLGIWCDGSTYCDPPPPPPSCGGDGSIQS